MEDLEETMASRAPEKTPMGSECPGNVPLEVRVSDGGCISQKYSCLVLRFTECTLMDITLLSYMSFVCMSSRRRMIKECCNGREQQ